ncbi:hypothetical protein FRC09_016043, partial [Ceratobasidium sp. 395]
MAPVTTAQADQVEQGVVEREDDKEETEGMRNLAVIGTFLAAVQAQCLGFQNLQDQQSGLGQAISGMLLVGMLLSTLGATHAVALAYMRSGKPYLEERSADLLNSVMEYNAAQKKIVEWAETACWRVIN